MKTSNITEDHCPVCMEAGVRLPRTKDESGVSCPRCGTIISLNEDGKIVVSPPRKGQRGLTYATFLLIALAVFLLLCIGIVLDAESQQLLDVNTDTEFIYIMDGNDIVLSVSRDDGSVYFRDTKGLCVKPYNRGFFSGEERRVVLLDGGSFVVKSLVDFRKWMK